MASAPFRRAVRALAWAAVILTVVLITVGGLVTNTDSGLACPDWPTCFGTPFPKLVGGVLMEHGHRYLATAVGFLSVLLVIATLTDRLRLLALMLLGSMPLILGGSIWAGTLKHRTGEVPLLAVVLILVGYALGLISTFRASGAGRHSQAALLLVITQGLLGGATVMYQLPPTILILHLATSMLFLVVLIWLAQRLGGPVELETSLSSHADKLIPIAAGAVYLQILLGAAVRHTGAGLICTDWLCKGALWPIGSGIHPAVHLHMAHRAFAMVAGALAIWAAIRARTTALHANDVACARVATAIPFLVLIQMSLGIATIWSLKDLWAVTAHLLVAALLLASFGWLWARMSRWMGKMSKVSNRSRVPITSAQSLPARPSPLTPIPLVTPVSHVTPATPLRHRADREPA